MDGAPVTVHKSVVGRHPIHHTWNNSPAFHVRDHEGKLLSDEKHFSRADALAAASRTLHQRRMAGPDAERRHDGKLKLPEAVVQAYADFVKTGSEHLPVSVKAHPDTPQYHALLRAMHEHRMPWAETMAALHEHTTAHEDRAVRVDMGGRTAFRESIPKEVEDAYFAFQRQVRKYPVTAGSYDKKRHDSTKENKLFREFMRVCDEANIDQGRVSTTLSREIIDRLAQEDRENAKRGKR